MPPNCSTRKLRLSKSMSLLRPNGMNWTWILLFWSANMMAQKFWPSNSSLARGHSKSIVGEPPMRQGRQNHIPVKKLARRIGNAPWKSGMHDSRICQFRRLKNLSNDVICRRMECHMCTLVVTFISSYFAARLNWNSIVQVARPFCPQSQRTRVFWGQQHRSWNSGFSMKSQPFPENLVLDVHWSLGLVTSALTSDVTENGWSTAVVSR